MNIQALEFEQQKAERNLEEAKRLKVAKTHTIPADNIGRATRSGLVGVVGVVSPRNGILCVDHAYGIIRTDDLITTDNVSLEDRCSVCGRRLKDIAEGR